jgi:hypothetical protein
VCHDQPLVGARLASSAVGSAGKSLFASSTPTEDWSVAISGKDFLAYLLARPLVAVLQIFPRVRWPRFFTLPFYPLILLTNPKQPSFWLI